MTDNKYKLLILFGGILAAIGVINFALGIVYEIFAWQILEIFCISIIGILLIKTAEEYELVKMFIGFGITSFAVAIGFFACFAFSEEIDRNLFILLCCYLTIIVLGIGIALLTLGINRYLPILKKQREEKKALREQERIRREQERIRREQERALYAEKIKDLPHYEVTQAEDSQPQEVLKFKKATLITLLVSYSLLLIAGVLLAAVPQMQSIISGIGICDEISARAYAITIGLMWIALTPSIGYYFATLPHFEISKKSKGIIATVTTLLLVAFTVIFFIIINTVEADGAVIKLYYMIESDSDTWFIPLSMVFGVLGIMICYALTLFRINPEKIKDMNSEQNGDGFIHTVTHVLLLLVGLVFKIVKGILRFKEKHVNAFIILATLLLTWLIFFTAFIFAIICIAIFVTVVILYFAKLVNFAKEGTSSSTCLAIYDGSKKIKLERQPYAGEDRYETVYKDEYGGTWYSTDGGNTVYKKE